MKFISPAGEKAGCPIPPRRPRKPASPEEMRRKARCASPVPPIPRPFDFGFTARRPLLPISAVALFLDREPRQVCELIEEGKLRWAFDLRSAKAKKREIRILRQSLFEYTGLYTPNEKPADEQVEFQQVTKLILPVGTILTPDSIADRKNYTAGKRPVHLLLRLPHRIVRTLPLPREPLLGAKQVAKCFSCASQHVIRLINEKTLQLVELRRGARASPLITRASLVNFLEKRRLS